MKAGWKGANRQSYEHIIGCAMVLLEQRASIDLKNKDTETPLMQAVGAPSPLGAELTTMLLHFSPNLEATDSFGRTALDHAIDACKAETVALLLAAGANPNPPLPHVVALTKNYLTPLQRAAENGSLAITRLLIEHGADVNAFPPVLPAEIRLRSLADRMRVEDFDEFGHICPKRPPLMCAIAGGHADVVKLLLENGADTSETGVQAVNVVAATLCRPIQHLTLLARACRQHRLGQLSRVCNVSRRRSHHFTAATCRRL